MHSHGRRPAILRQNSPLRRTHSTGHVVLSQAEIELLINKAGRSRVAKRWSSRSTLTISAEARSRVRKACLNCRRRKSRCIFHEGKGPCERCARERVECHVPLTTRRGGFANVLAGKERQKREAMFRLQALRGASQEGVDDAAGGAGGGAKLTSAPSDPVDNRMRFAGSAHSRHPHSLHADTVHAVMSPHGGLPHVAVPQHAASQAVTPQGATPRTASPSVVSPQMPSPPIAQRSASIPLPSRSVSRNTARRSSHGAKHSKAAGNALHHELYSVNDALNILCSVVNEQRQQAQAVPDPNDPLARLPPLAHLRNAVPQTTFLPPIVPPQFSESDPYANTLLAQKGLISVSQIGSLVQFFYMHLEPFFPFVHEQFTLNVRLPQQPLLLTTICTISAKYSPDLNLRVLQTKLWEQCQKLLADIPWQTEGGGEGNDDQVAAAILALLLLCEWLVDGLDTTEQYNRVSWMHVGNAVRLAQCSGILSHNKPVYMAVHWLENVIGCRIGVQPALHGTPPPLKIRQHLGLEDEARLNVINLLHLGYRTLYSSREATRESVENGSYLMSLQLLHPHFERWLTEFAEVARNQDSWGARSIMFEFNHCRLYVYSLALAQRAAGTAGASALMESRKYLPYAIDSAVAIINFETDPRNPVGLQLGPPMRWIVRFIHAAVFLAKALLCPPLVHPTETVESLVAVICKAAAAMEIVGPDNFQLMGRYIKMMNDIKDHVIDHMSNTRTVSPTNGQTAARQTSGTSSPTPEDSMRSLYASAVDTAPSSLAYWDMLEESGLLAGVDNTMLYMPAQCDGEVDGLTVQ